MSTKRDFTGRVVLITGSSSGIGAQTAIEFSRAGAQVVITGRNAKNLTEVGKQCLEVSPKKLKPLEVVADVSKENDCKQLIDKTITSFGKLHVLVNNAAAGQSFLTVEDPKIMQTFDQLINLNLRSVVYLTHLSVKHLEKTKGNIVNISSVAGLKPFASFGVYCMTKAALDMFTKTTALELGPKGIRVNVINPGAVHTNFGVGIGMDQAAFTKLIDDQGKDYPLRRPGQPTDIANAILFLAADESEWFTGANLLTDGGALHAPLKPLV